MWYLYKRELPSGILILIMKSDNPEALKSEARSLAIKDGYTEHFWVYPIETGVAKSYEMPVDNQYKFIVREWE